MNRGTELEPDPSRGRRWLRLAALALPLVVVEVGSLAGGDRVNQLAEVLPGADKVLHTLAFFGLSLLVQWAARRWSASGVGSAGVAMGLAAVAVADELAQAFQPARHLDVADLAASLAGIGLGLGWAHRQGSKTRAALLIAAASLASVGVTTASYFDQRHLVAALRYERAGNFVEARREYRAAFDAGVRTPGLFNELAWVEIESGVGDAPAAVTYAAQALALTPDDPDVHDTYGWALHHAGRSAEALPYLERAFRAKPDMFCIHYHLGEVYLALGQTERAVAHLRRQVDRPDTREAAKAAATLARLTQSR